MKILTILGNRPQFIKAHVVSREFLSYKKVQEVVVHSGQHYDDNMSGLFFRQLGMLPPDYNLGVKANNNSEITGQIINKLNSVLTIEKPDIVLVFGDTNTTLAGAIAARQHGIPLAHIEAGLRSFDEKMPEELNRIVTDRISQWLFCPTRSAVNNLVNEGFDKFQCKICLSGDVMLDSFQMNKIKAKPPITILPSSFALTTIHRSCNVDDPHKLSEIILALNRIHKDLPLVAPLHPRTTKKLLSIKEQARFMIIPPVGYLEMIYLLKRCKMIITDSGGLQKEAYFARRKCLTIRERTEWIETIETGGNLLCHPKKKEILNAFQKIKSLQPSFNQTLFGNGKAGQNIVETLLNS